MRARRALSLVEVLVAGAVLAMVLAPLLGYFSATAGDAGDDMRRMEATNLAQEILEQVDHLHKRLGKLPPIPFTADGALPMTDDGYLDLEKYAERFVKEQGVPLLFDTSRCAWNSRLFLTPARPAYQRHLKIAYVEAAPTRRNMWADTLWQARIRVRYEVPVAGQERVREVLLVSNYFQKCRPEAKFRDLQ